jgi:serine/threonine protein kinase
MHKKSKARVAVKVFDRSKVAKDRQEQLGLQNEIELLKSVGKYACFPTFMGTYLTDHSYYLIYEWAEGTTLKEWVQRGLACEPEIKHIAKQLSEALAILNMLNIAHRDIKP